MQTPLRHDRFAPSEPLVPDEESLPAEQPIPEEQIRAEPSHDPTTIWSFYVFVLLVLYIRLVNPIFCMCYKLGLEIVLEIIHCIFLFQVIYIYILFDYIPFSHYSFLFGTCGLRYSIPPLHSDFVSLRRYHFLPLFLIAFETLRTIFILVGGRVEKGSFVVNIKLFWYFSWFLLKI